ncbi:unnamed protein product [Symbiodinium sp. CCMP2456]|nr:unnamed protein product [Symbiodinium sp. CCMP2456]
MGGQCCRAPKSGERKEVDAFDYAWDSTSAGQCQDPRAAELVRMYDLALANFVRAGGNKASLVRPDSSDDLNDPYMQDQEDSDGAATAPAATASAASEPSGSDRDLAAPEVHEHYSVDDIGPRSLLELLEELSVKDDELPALTPYVDGDDLGETTVASSSGDVGETTVASSSGDLGETTVASTTGDSGETTVTTVASTEDSGETTVASTKGDSCETTVASNSRDSGETTTVASSSRDSGETTVAPLRSADAGGDTEAARAKARQLQLKALLAASARKLSELKRANAMKGGSADSSGKLVMDNKVPSGSMDAVETQPWDGLPSSPLPLARASTVIDLDTPEKSLVKEEGLDELPPAAASAVEPVEPLTSPEPTPKPKQFDLVYKNDLTPEKQVLTRDAQLRIKAASEDAADGKPGRGRGRGRGRGSKATKKDTKQSKKTAPKAPAADPDSAEWEAEAEWDDEEWAQWEAEAEWNDEEWAQWEKGTWKPKGKRSRDVTKVAKAPEPASRSKPVGRARPGDHASIHAVDETDTFSYPHTFARRSRPPIKGSDSEKVWMGIAKTFIQEISFSLENRTRTEAEAIYWKYARLRWVDSGIAPTDPGFPEFMEMIAQEFVVLRPTAADLE